MIGKKTGNGIIIAVCMILFFTSALIGTATADANISQAQFSGLGSYSNIYSRYYSGNTVAGILKMQVPPGNNVPPSPYDAYCIDLFKPISIGNIIVADGDLEEAQALGPINWCAVNYILANYIYTQTYPSGHPLYNLNQNERAAAIQGAIWYFVTAPYGPYNASNPAQKYQFLTDPATNPAGNTRIDAYPLRNNSMGIINSVPGCLPAPCALGGTCTAGTGACSGSVCNASFQSPVRITMTPGNVTNCGCQTLTATVYDQNGAVLPNISVRFRTDHGTLAPTSGTSNSTGQVSTVLNMTGSPFTANVQASAEGTFGSFLYDPSSSRQSLTTLTLLPGSVAANSTVTCQAEPAIVIEKYVSNTSTGPWYEADTPPGLLVPGGSTVYYKFNVTNRGNTWLTSVTLSDNRYTPCSVSNTLAPGASSECVIGPYTAMPNQTYGGPVNNTATTTGVNGTITVTHSDDAYYTPTYLKSGTVFIDKHGDGILRPDDPGIPNVTVFLCLGCPVDSAAPVNTIGITKTDQFGNYSFPNLPACYNSTDECYIVSVLSQTDDFTDVNEYLHDWFRIVETSKVKWNAAFNRSCIRFNLLDNETGNNFGFIQPGNVSGYKFRDLTGTGTENLTLEGWNISLVNKTTGQLVAWAVTGPNGSYRFENLSWGEYYLNETPQTWWRQTKGNYTVNVTGTSLSFVRNFTNQLVIGNISGVKYHDANSDGNLDSDSESVIPGWNISLFYANNNTFITSQLTDANGTYHFNFLDPFLTYNVTEELQAGWMNTTPRSNVTDFTNATVCPGTFHIRDDALLLSRMPNARLVFVPESRIGNNGPSGDYELDIHYIDPAFTVMVQAQATWTNGTDLPFNLTYVPNANPALPGQVNYTVGSVSPLITTAHVPTTEPFAFTDFAIRTRATRANSRIDVYNLSLTVQGVTIPITNTGYGQVNTSFAFGPSSPGDLDIFWIRANVLAQGVDPTLDIMQGFTLTGTQRMTWNASNTPSGSQLAYQIKVGKPICPIDNNRFIVFGNRQMAGNISGFKLNASNNQGLAGWNITLTNTTTGILQNFTLTAFNGNYTFGNVPFGTYFVNETPQTGWNQLTGNFTVTLNATTISISNLNFTNARINGTISGTKYNDLNANGTRDPGEPALPGWRINLRTTSLITFTTTDSNGNYTFTNVTWGIYNITETGQNGWTIYQPVSPTRHVIEINATNLTYTGLDFGNHYSIISGYKLDPDGNGLACWTLSLYNQTTGAFLQQVLTNASGYYQFDPIDLPGGYTIRETLQPGFMLISPPGGLYNVTINRNNPDATGRNFTNMQLGNISGYKRDPAGNPLASWQIGLYNASSQVGTVTTGADGVFRFDNLTWGDYVLNETLQPGYLLTNPSSGSYSLKVNGTNLVFANQNFTNMQLGNISGYKLDPEGTPLANWQIGLYNASGQVGTVTTGPTGFFRFDNLSWGDYVLNETLQPGYLLTNPSSGSYSLKVNGTNLVFANQNFTNMQLGNISGYKLDPEGTPLANWQIGLYNASGQVVSVTTGPTGVFRFDNLSWGDYVLNETLQPGYLLTNPPSGSYSLKVNGTNLVFANQNFTNMQLGNISGYKLDPEGTPLANWQIRLYNASGQVGTVTTGADGTFRFDNLTWGDYIVNETLKTGFSLLSPAGGSYQIELNGTSLVFVNQNFTNMQLGNISGYKRDPAGTPLSGWQIKLYNASGQVGTVTTGADGFFRFNNLTWGDYILNETLKTGFSLVSPAGGSYQLKLNGTSLVFLNQNFTNMQLGNISGIKWNDLNGNGVRDVNEPVLPGWVITLKYPNGTVYGTKTTGADGSFAFPGLAWGKYNLSETLQPNWTQTKPAGNVYTVEINGTSINVFGKDFGNRQNISCCSCPTGAYFTNTIAGRTVTFKDNSTGNPVQWSWTFGDGTTSTLRNPVKTYTRAGTFTVKENVKGMRCDGSTYWVSYTKRVTVK